jgi:glycosyltransferase involved in cell wall biosynthesis
MADSFRVVALISAYNEEDVIGAVIGHLAENGVEVYVIDDRSTDDTVAEARAWLGRGLLGVETFPELAPRGPRSSGRFVWSAILRRKVRLATEIPADWFIHHDADEIREGPWEGLSLRDSIRRVDRLGYNAIDFRVLNFPPVDDGFRRGDDPRAYFRLYEAGALYDKVQIKCWKKTGARVSLPASGGHEARFAGRRVFPIQFLLRHYPIRGQAHGTRKVFHERKTRFLARERHRGWHVQYDDIVDDDYVFVRDPATLTPFDPVRTRFELVLHNRLVNAAEERLAKAEAAGRAARLDLRAAKAEVAALSERVRVRDASPAAEAATPGRQTETAGNGPHPMSLIARVDVARIEPEAAKLWGAHLDRPLPGTADPASVEVAGWVLGRSSPAAAVELVRNGQVVRRIPTGISRPDLQAAFPQVPGAEGGGFRTVLSLLGGAAALDLAVQAVLHDHTRVPFASIRARLRWPEGTDGPALVTVVIPCYNQARYLGFAIESVLAQTYPHVEVLVVDDGSTDNTSIVAARYPGVRSIRQANHGVAAARNEGLRQSSGEFLVFLDADDRLLPRAVEIGLKHLGAHPECAFVSGFYRELSSDGRTSRPAEQQRIEGDPYLALLSRGYIGMPGTVMYRREVFTSVGGFETTLSPAEDHDIYLRISRQHPVHCHGEVVAEYRDQGSSASRDPTRMLQATVAAHRAQWKHVRNLGEQHREAYRAGLRYWQEGYGPHVAAELVQLLRQRDWPRLVTGARALSRDYPRGFLRVARNWVATRGRQP